MDGGVSHSLIVLPEDKKHLTNLEHSDNAVTPLPAATAEQVSSSG